MLTPQRRRVADAHEGPVYVPAEDAVYFATARHERDAPAPGPLVALRRWRLGDDAVEDFVDDARVANGFALARDGEALLVCEQGDRERPGCIARYALGEARREVLAERYRGQRFNSPNKLLELPGGAIVFTDPDYGVRQGFRPPSPLGTGVYLRRPGGEVVRLGADLLQPHGLALSADAAHLFVSDTAADDGTGGFHAECPHHVWRYRLDAEAGALSEPTRLLASPSGIPDGMACDAEGRLYCATGDGIRAYRGDDGALLHHQPIDGGAVGLWLDEASGRLFATTDEAVAVYAVDGLP